MLIKREDLYFRFLPIILGFNLIRPQHLLRRKDIKLHQLPSSLLSARMALLLLLIDILLGVVGFTLIEGFGLMDAVYMTIITLSTVGYTEVQPLSTIGQLFTSVFILLNIGLFAYLVSVFSYYIIEGEIFKNMHTNLIRDNIDKLSGHVILCGYGRYGKEAAGHFLKHDIPFVIVDESEEEIENLQKSEKELLYILDDATHDEALVQAGIQRARALVTSLPEDADNVFTVLTARQLNPKINIISRAKDPRSERKLMLAGADHVVMPEQIGGFYMATLVSQPGAVEFFSFITNEYRSDIGFEEVTYKELPPTCQGLSIRDLNLRSATGTNIIGFKHAEGNYEVNPSPDTVLAPNTSFIALGNEEQLTALRNFFYNYPEEEKKESS